MLTMKRHSIRRAGIAIPALVVLPFVLMALLVAIAGRQFHDIHIRLHNESDAAALAGADVLAHDDFLRGYIQSGANASQLFDRLELSRLAVRNFAMINPVYGGFSVPEWNTVDPPAGDILYGLYDRDATVPFTAYPLEDSSSMAETNLHEINSLRVYIRRNRAANNAISIPHMPLAGNGKVDATVRSTVLLDNDIIGFRPLFATRPLPLSPIALEAANWNLMFNTSPDVKSFNATTGQFDDIPDQLPEITVTLTIPMPSLSLTPTGALLDIGLTSFNDFLAQITNGVYASQLAAAPFGGSFTLQPDTSTMPGTMKLAVPGEPTFTPANGPDLATTLGLLAQTPSQPRIYPLYTAFDSNGDAIITRFVAARLVAAKPLTNLADEIEGIQLTLQPTRMSVPSATTNRLYRNYVGVSNPFILKVRLVP